MLESNDDLNKQRSHEKSIKLRTGHVIDNQRCIDLIVMPPGYNTAIHPFMMWALNLFE